MFKVKTNYKKHDWIKFFVYYAVASILVGAPLLYYGEYFFAPAMQENKIWLETFTESKVFESYLETSWNSFDHLLETETGDKYVLEEHQDEYNKKLGGQFVVAFSIILGVIVFGALSFLLIIWLGISLVTWFLRIIKLEPETKLKIERVK